MVCLCISLVPYLTELIIIKARNCFTFCARLGFLLDMGRTHLHGGFLACQDGGSCYWQRQREHRNLELVDSFPQTCGQTRKSSRLAFFVYWFPCLLQFALGMCGRTLCFFPGGLLVELEMVCLFQNLQTGTRFPSRLVVFIKRYSVSVSQVSPSALCWTRDLLGHGLSLVLSFWLQPRKCCCYPKCSRNNCKSVVPT